MRYNVLIGGAAGSGPNFLAEILGNVLVENGFYVFLSRDYQSLIRGGHNFNVLTFSDKPVFSNESKINILVALDKITLTKHKKELKKNGVVIGGEKQDNMFLAGQIFKILKINFKELDKKLKLIKKRYKENLEQAKKGYASVDIKFKLPVCKNKNVLMNGSQGVAWGAINSGLDLYYAYPMTPATPLLRELAQNSINKENKHKTVELENEISVANAGVGSAMTGKLTMVGTSGGGFDLMTETLSLCGMAEVPLVFYLAMRKGPATGVATYTSQEDLKMVLNAGHGEFQRVVVAPGDPIEAQELISECFYFAQKFQTPCILVSDKHLGESFYSVSGKPKLTKVPRLTKLKRYNSYEIDPETRSATEDAELTAKGTLARKKKGIEIAKHAKKFNQFKVYGNKDSKNVVLSWGSTKGAILDAIHNLDVCFIQVLYLNPFPKQLEKELKDKNVLLVENTSEGQLADVLRKETGIEIQEKNKILRYDARPFLSDELNKEIKRRLKK